MKLGEIKAHGVFTCRVELADAFEDDPDLKAVYDGSYVTFRELTADEQLKTQAQKENVLPVLTELLPGCIVDHNIEREDGKKASNVEVGEIIKRSSTLFTHVTKVWAQSLPLARRSAGGSTKPAA